MENRLTIIYLVRHGQSEANASDKVGGQSDPDLTETGRKQVESTKKKLDNVHFDAVYSSDLKRAYETAAILYGKTVPRANRLKDLRERDYGSLEGQSNVHLKTYQKALVNLPENERWDYHHAEGMESEGDLVGRFLGQIENIAQQNPGKTVLIVGHGAAIRAVLVKLGYGKHEDLPPQSFINAGVVELIYDGSKFTVRSVEGIDDKIVEDSKS